MKLNIKFFLFGGIVSIILTSCFRKKLVIYIDEVSQFYSNSIVEEYQKKYPEKHIEVYIYNSDFLFQAIKIGKKPDVLVSFDTSYSKKFGLQFPNKRLLNRDAMVLAVADSQIHSWNDILTKGKYLALPMQNTSLQPFSLQYLNYQKIANEQYFPVYPHDFKSMALYLERKMVSGGIMLKSQADYYKIRNLFPYFHQSFLHYVVELSPSD
ncbi:MAG: hypothetical protein KatS3mg035_0332 [Bacteroidia bacterium]|nr:MAG: hypothetical protein KatS3mg035_0332 [Bacteroidia bacterium]